MNIIKKIKLLSLLKLIVGLLFVGSVAIFFGVMSMNNNTVEEGSGAVLGIAGFFFILLAVIAGFQIHIGYKVGHLLSTVGGAFIFATLITLLTFTASLIIDIIILCSRDELIKKHCSGHVK